LCQCDLGCTEYLVIRLDQCFVLGPNWFGDTTAAPNIGNLFFSVLCLTTDLFQCYLGCTEYLVIRLDQCFVLGPNWFGAT
jgi:hypothetical protein